MLTVSAPNEKKARLDHVSPIKVNVNLEIPHSWKIWYRGIQGGPQLGPHYAERCEPLSTTNGKNIQSAFFVFLIFFCLMILLLKKIIDF